MPNRIPKHSVKKRRSNKQRNLKKKGGNAEPSFQSGFGGAYYSLNQYENDLFGMTESSNLHGGTKRKRGKMLRRTPRNKNKIHHS